MRKEHQHIILLFCTVASMYSQDSVEKIFNRFSSQSFIKQNTYLLNPTFTVVNESGKSIALLSRNSFIGFEDSPVVNILGFSGRVSENIGAGVGVYRQRIGVFTNFGAVANYAYQIKLTSKSLLALGFNFLFSHIDLDRTRIMDPTTDPVIFNFQERTNIILQSALSYNYGKFNVGINLRDVVDYNIKEGEFITPISEKSFSVHAQYSEPLNSTIRLLKDGVLRFFYSANHNTNSNFTGTILLDLPKLGWLQGGYDDFFGSSAGLGIQLSQKVAISYVYETGKNDLGPTSEIGIVYSFSQKPKPPITYNVKLNTKIDTKKRDDETDTKIIQKDTLQKTKLQKIIREKDTLEIRDSLPIDKKIIKAPKIEIVKKTKELEEGYYLIVNVFSQKKYAESFVEDLINDGLTPKFFIHPTKKYRYVYIAFSKNKREILKLIYNNVNGNYIHEKWILQVEN